jgi:hypothetical protein
VLIKKHGFSAFTRGFAAAQHTRIPRLHVVFYLIFFALISQVFWVYWNFFLHYKRCRI